MAEVLKIKLVEPNQLSLFKQPLAQIEQALHEPNQPPVKLYYVHYIDYNKRLDEWVTIDRMRLDKIQAPVSSSSSGGSSALANSHSASQSHLCNISNSNLKELTASGSLKHDLSGSEEHGLMPPKKKKASSNKQTPAVAAAAGASHLTASLHGSVSVPVNLVSSAGRPSAASSGFNEATTTTSSAAAATATVIEQTPSTPSSTLNETQDGLSR